MHVNLIVVLLYVHELYSPQVIVMVFHAMGLKIETMDAIFNIYFLC